MLQIAVLSVREWLARARDLEKSSNVTYLSSIEMEISRQSVGFHANSKGHSKYIPDIIAREL